MSVTQKLERYLDQQVAGNEQAKRALHIAIAGNLTIRFIGADEATALADIGREHDATAYAMPACPCGNLGDEQLACHCTPDEVARHRRQHECVEAHLTVETSRPPVRVIMKWLARTRQLEGLSEQARAFLSTAAAKLHLSPSQVVRVLEVARTIASVSNQAGVTPPAVAEALQYRPRPSAA